MFAKQVIPDLCTVVLRHSVESKGRVLAKGQHGTVLHAWSDGEHYLVEFTEGPTAYVADVGRDDIYLA
jgi:Domain of unknown function (DUF4926)